MTKLLAALAQINTTVGDLRGNTAKIIEYIDRARAEGADLVSFPELTITGYPPEDLLYKHNLIRDNRECLDRGYRAFGGDRRGSRVRRLG